MACKQFILFLFLLFSINSVYGQNIEYGVSINSGLYSYAGKTAEPVSFISNNLNWEAYTNNPYGSLGGMGVGLSGFYQSISKGGFIWGLDGGYDLVRSKINIDMVYEVGIVVNEYEAKGSTQLESQFLNLFPYIGYRMDIGKINLDINIGADLGYNLRTWEKGKAIFSEGEEISTSVNRRTTKYDIRPRVQLNLWYQNVGVYAGYSLGIINYTSELDGADSSAYTRYMRFGIKYKI